MPITLILGMNFHLTVTTFPVNSSIFFFCKLVPNYLCLHFPHMMQKMINGMTVNRWACINFSRSVQESVARGFCSELAQMCQVSGMVMFGLILSWFSKIKMFHILLTYCLIIL